MTNDFRVLVKEIYVGFKLVVDFRGYDVLYAAGVFFGFLRGDAEDLSKEFGKYFVTGEDFLRGFFPFFCDCDIVVF